MRDYNNQVILLLFRYDIMWQCWQRNPTDRPHFAVIHDNLEELVESKIVSFTCTVQITSNLTLARA